MSTQATFLAHHVIVTDISGRLSTARFIGNVSHIDFNYDMSHSECMPADFLVDFGAAVRRLRERRSLTQSSLAEQVGLGRTSMTNLERGKQNPPLTLLPRLAQALGVSVVELVTEASLPAAPSADDVLVAHVQDDQLRRWANQVIGDHRPPSAVESTRAKRTRQT